MEGSTERWCEEETMKEAFSAFTWKTDIRITDINAVTFKTEVVIKDFSRGTQ